MSDVDRAAEPPGYRRFVAFCEHLQRGAGAGRVIHLPGMWVAAALGETAFATLKCRGRAVDDGLLGPAAGEADGYVFDLSRVPDPG